MRRVGVLPFELESGLCKTIKDVVFLCTGPPVASFGRQYTTTICYNTTNLQEFNQMPQTNSIHSFGTFGVGLNSIYNTLVTP